MSSSGRERVFEDAIERARTLVNARLVEIVARQTDASDEVREAIEYTLLDGGKRLRPVMCLWTHDGVGGTQHDACLDVACALECMHTYSLIHDDLPCMDDDDMRRGKPSCHKRFGEALAVLTGDALLTLCFDVIVSLGQRWPVEDGVIVEVARVVARAGGTSGLITGQALDLACGGLEASLDTVDRIHRHKTAALISASMLSGAVVGGGDEPCKARIERAGNLAGQAFQIVDDVLDVEMDVETLGKTPGKDAQHGKLTYPALASVEDSRRRAAQLIAEAKSELSGAVREPLLEMLFEFFMSRKK